MGCAIDESKMVWVWGDNSKGELGVGDYSERKFPYPVVGLKGKTVNSISIGSQFTIAIGETIDLGTGKKHSPEHKRIKSNQTHEHIYMKDSLATSSGSYGRHPDHDNSFM